MSPAWPILLAFIVAIFISMLSLLTRTAKKYNYDGMKFALDGHFLYGIVLLLIFIILAARGEEFEPKSTTILICGAFSGIIGLTFISICIQNWQVGPA